MARLGLLAAAALMMFQAFFIFAPMGVLGAAIGWPASLDFPASQILPLIHAQDAGMRLGYGLYLIWSLAFGVSIAVIASYSAKDGTTGGLGALAIGLGVASSLARATGIIRWPTGSAELAAMYQAPGLDPAQRAAIEAVQTMLNAYGGSIGELLGVGLFGAMAICAVGVLIMARGGLPWILGLVAIPVGLIMASPAIVLLGMTPPLDIVITVTASNLWFAALGVAFLAKAASPRAN